MSIVTAKIKILVIFVILLVLPFNFVRAGFTPQIKVFDSKLSLLSIHPLGDLSSLDIARLDLGGDGIDEIAIASGEYNPPNIYILRADGTEISRFLAYDREFNGGVNITACDLDGDEKDELITGAGRGGGPQVRIFDGFGQPKFTPGFFAGDEQGQAGVKVACGDVNGDGANEIITGVLTDEGVSINFYIKESSYLVGGFLNRQFKHDFDLETVDLGGDGASEIIIAGGRDEPPRVKVFRQDGGLINEFLVYGENFLGGVNLASADINSDGRDEIIVGAGFLGGPHLRIFDGYGNLIDQRFVFAANFRGGVQSIVGNFSSSKPGKEILSVPNYTPVGRQDPGKYIEIDLSADTLSYYQQGLLLGSYSVSLGRRGYETPKGEFKVLSKDLKAWSEPYGLWMPYWLGLGRFGIHELPIWPSGYREGADHLGKKVSHGCIRLGIGPAEELYRWTEIGTRVIIHE